MRVSKAAFEKDGIGPAAASVEIARRTRKKRIMIVDKDLLCSDNCIYEVGDKLIMNVSV